MRIEDVTEATEDTWRELHNRIIPASPIPAEEMPGRRRRNLLTLAHVGEQVVGNATVRPPTDHSDTATVIVRILPEHRRRGHGSEYLAAMLERAQALGAVRIETVVLVANADGLRFALRHGFTEIERYEVDGAEYLDLVLSRTAAP